MTRKTTTLSRLAAHYDSVDTSAELEDATVAGRPDGPPAAERMTTFAVRLPVATLDHVRDVAARRNVTTSALIRGWIEAGVAGMADDERTEDRFVPVRALLELIGRAPRDHSGP